MIAEANASVALLESLPDEQNNYQAFRQAGAYHLDKANLLLSQPQGENNPELRRLHSRALSLLDRAVMVAAAGARAVPGASPEPKPTRSACARQPSLALGIRRWHSWRPTRHAA